MTVQGITALYEQQIKPLSRADRLLLLVRIAEDLAIVDESVEQELNLLDLEGLGEEIWRGIDAQQYVNQLRDEWASARCRTSRLSARRARVVGIINDRNSTSPDTRTAPQ